MMQQAPRVLGVLATVTLLGAALFAASAAEATGPSDGLSLLGATAPVAAPVAASVAPAPQLAPSVRGPARPLSTRWRASAAPGANDDLRLGDRPRWLARWQLRLLGWEPAAAPLIAMYPDDPPVRDTEYHYETSRPDPREGLSESNWRLLRLILDNER